ncbi:MAG: TetR/AcrR family transcriptional regulator [Pseudomonadales bacterium]
MPYSSEHKRQTRQKILEAARGLFNAHGFSDVTIDMVMQAAGLTRGGFYNHFASKQALYAEAVASFLTGRGAQWRAAAGVHPEQPAPDIIQRMLNSYLSAEHLADLDGQCPMIALPSDVAREGPEVRGAYQRLLEAMVGLFQRGGAEQAAVPRETAQALAALCVGGMVLARTLPDSDLAAQVRSSALQAALSLCPAE